MKITPSQAAVLSQVEEGKHTMNEIRGAIGFSKTQFYAASKKLINKGLLTKGEGFPRKYYRAGGEYEVQEFFKPGTLERRTYKRVEEVKLPEYPALDAFLSLPVRAA